MAIEVTPPFKEFTDLSGAPLDNGYIYIGTENLNPEVNLISIYWDEAFTTPAANPVRTIAGYPSRNGYPGRIFAKSAFSITVKDKNSQLVYSSLSSNNIAQNTIVGTIAALRTTIYSGQPFVSVTGYYTAADNIGVREYCWDSASTTTDNGGTIIQVTGVVAGRWKMKSSGAIRLVDFGAKADGATDASTIAATAYAVNANIELSGGVFVIATPPAGAKFFTLDGSTCTNGAVVVQSFNSLNTAITALSGTVSSNTSRITSLETSQTVQDVQIGSLQASQAAGVIGFTTKALMDADLAHSANTLAMVTNDPTPAYNTTYIKLGASGIGSWQISSSDRITLVEQDVNVIDIKELSSVSRFYSPTKTDALLADASFTIGGSTVAGTNAGAGTVIFTGLPTPKGYLDSFSCYCSAADIIKIKRIKPTGVYASGTVTFVEEITVNCVTGLNTFSLASGTLGTLRFDDGDFLAINPTLGKLAYTASTGNTTPNQFIAGDFTTTATLNMFLVPDNTTRYEVSAVIKYPSQSIVSNELEINNDYSDDLSVGAHDVSIAGTSTAADGISRVFDQEFKNSSILKTISLNAASASDVMFFGYSKTASGMALKTIFSVKVASGISTLTAGVDFPDGIIIDKDGMFGYKVLTGALLRDTFSTTQLYHIYGYPRDLITTFDARATTAAMPHIKATFKQSTNTKSIYNEDRANIINHTFNSIIPYDFTATNWSIAGSVAVNSVAGIANKLEFKKNFYSMNFTTRYKASISAGGEFCFGAILAGGTVSHTMRVKLTGNTFGFAIGTSDIITVGKTCAFTLTASTNYIFEIKKTYRSVTVSILNPVTGDYDSVTSDQSGIGYGFFFGRPFVAAISGTISLVSMQMFTGIKNPKVHIFGDSVTEGSGTTVDSAMYGSLVNTNCGGALVTGYSGSTSTGVYAYFREVLSITRPRYVIVYIGINDTNMTDWQNNINLMAGVSTEYGAIPVFCTLAPEDTDTNPVLVQNPFLRASGHRLIHLDKALTVGGDGVTRNTALFADSLHPNDAGNLAIYNRIRIDLPEIFDWEQ